MLQLLQISNAADCAPVEGREEWMNHCTVLSPQDAAMLREAQLHAKDHKSQAQPQKCSAFSSQLFSKVTEMISWPLKSVSPLKNVDILLICQLNPKNHP